MIYLSVALSALWILVTGYVFFMSRRQRSLELELQVVEEMVNDVTSKVNRPTNLQ